MQPNLVKPGDPKHTTRSKKIVIFLSNIEYNQLNTHVEYSYQHMGAGQSILGNKEVKFNQICTIILIGTMISALKLFARFTLSIGTLTLESAIFIYSWMPPHMALVTVVFISLVIINKIEKKYFDGIKNYTSTSSLVKGS